MGRISLTALVAVITLAHLALSAHAIRPLDASYTLKNNDLLNRINAAHVKTERGRFKVSVKNLGTSVTPVKTFQDFLTHPVFGVQGSKNSGTCAACTVVLSLVEGLVKVNEKPVDKVVAELCDYLPLSPLKDICKDIITWFGPFIINGIERKKTPDVICQEFQLCTNPTCNLWPIPPSAKEAAPKTRVEQTEPGTSAKSVQDFLDRLPTDLKTRLQTAALSETPWQWLQNLINRFANSHEPAVDLDNDFFGTSFGLRGYSWRGKDCDDLDNTTYPGRIPVPPYTKDVNCNGIFGVDPKGVAYEDLLCANTTRLGTVVMGDSVGAHFELPPEWFHPASINKTTYDDIIVRLEDEFDLPYRSLTTGTDLSVGNVTSIYLHNRNNNLCNNEDYQNLGVNGMASHDMTKLVKSLKRDPNKDHPVLIVFELVGNDVCNSHLSGMTTPEDFYNNNLESLQYLDTILPKGSHIVFIGLADGRVLWDSLHDRLHPIGVKYSAVYEWLTCLDLNPCSTWLNWNETVRNETTARAVQLSQTYQQLLQQNFTNFDMAYYDFPFNKIITKWEAEGGQAWELIEPVDGFHPNQVANYLIAQDLISQLQQDHPTWLASVNPMNSLITTLFGITPIVYPNGTPNAEFKKN